MNASRSYYCHTDNIRTKLDEVEKLKATNGQEQEEEDNKKVSRLVKQYNEFPIFFFNPGKGTEQYFKC